MALQSLKSLDCLVIGDALYDVNIRLLNNDLSLAPGETNYCDQILIVSGGAGNVAVGVSVLGGTSGFVGMVGNDSFGKSYVADLEMHGVQTRVFYNPKIPTGICICFVFRDGERTFFVHRGANDHLSLKEINEVHNLLVKAKMLYVSGFSLVSQAMQNVIRYAVKLAAQNNTKVMFDPASYDLVLSKRNIFWEIVKHTDYLCLTFHEAQALTEIENVAEIVNKLTQYADLVALKMGRNGCTMATRQMRIHVKAEAVDCIDSTGAGDCFASAVVFGLTNGLSPGSIGKLGNLLAAYKVQHIGSRCFPSRKEVQYMLSEARASVGSRSREKNFE